MRSVLLPALLLFSAEMSPAPAHESDAAKALAVEINTKAGSSMRAGTVYVENEIVVSREFDVLHGLSLGIENLVTGDVAPVPAIAEEATLGARFSVLPAVTLGLAGKVFVEGSGITWAPDIILGVGYEWEEAGVSLSDESEFLLRVPGSVFEYVNTFEFGMGFSMTDTRSFFVALEHELVVSGGRAEGTALLGPGYSWRFISVYANYVLGWDVKRVEHGVEVGVNIGFEL